MGRACALEGADRNRWGICSQGVVEGTGRSDKVVAAENDTQRAALSGRERHLGALCSSMPTHKSSNVHAASLVAGGKLGPWQAGPSMGEPKTQSTGTRKSCAPTTALSSRTKAQDRRSATRRIVGWIRVASTGHSTRARSRMRIRSTREWNRRHLSGPNPLPRVRRAKAHRGSCSGGNVNGCGS